MENSELIKRAEDLMARCERKYELTHTGFLTPAEAMELKKWAAYTPDCRMVLNGGNAECERVMAFFLPEYLDEEAFDPAEYIHAIKLTAHFGAPGHRDYLGALLGMGVERDRIGDIFITGSVAYIFCTEGILRHLLSIEKVGRCGVTAQELSLTAVAAPPKSTKPVTFSVMSARLDAVCAGMFNLSRTEAARAITSGNVNVNYALCDKTDLQIKEGDIISLRGSGKGTVAEFGGTSRKGRRFIKAEIYK